MAMQVAARLLAARCRRFIGRAAERAMFLDALASTKSVVQLLYISGPGGSGKSALLNEFFCECQTSDIPVLLVDGHDIAPSPQDFVAALRAAAPAQDTPDPWLTFRSALGKRVLLIDTYEMLTSLDDWLRVDFLPQLTDTLVVMAGQDPLGPAWRADLGWQGFMRTINLGNLTAEESRAYLTSRNVPADQQQAVIAFTHGYPLALSLVADAFEQRPGMQFHPEATPDVVRMLLEHFVQRVPGPAYRAALEACSLVRWTNEALLAEMLATPDAHDVFDWLRSLSFIESGQFGLFPHDLAREALVADLRWRNPDWFATLHARARSYYHRHFETNHGPGQLHVVLDYFYLHRRSPLVQPYFHWQDSENIYRDTVKPADRQPLLAMVRLHEGEQSAALAAEWFDRQPQGVAVFRNGTGQPVGFLVMITLDHANRDDQTTDPAVQAQWHFLEQHTPLRKGEHATLLRFWMARDNYQAVSPVQSLIFAHTILHSLTTHGLAFTFLPCADPDFWAPVFSYADVTRLPDADFEVGGRRYSVYGHDWRVIPPLTWLGRLAIKETVVSESAGALSADNEPLIVLSQTEFESAVRCALREAASPQRLRNNPLLRSRLVSDRVGPQASDGERMAALQSLLAEAVESLHRLPRGDKLYRAIQASFFWPSFTQEQAAEALDLPFSTFRRHAQNGLAQVIEYLWQKEINDMP